MVITWYGQSCFKIQSGEFVLTIDPFSKEIGRAAPRFRSDIVLITHEHYDHANAESLSGDPFVINGAGEYEVKGVYVHGIETFHDKSSGKERGMNTMYMIKMEGLTILHMGDFGEGKLRDETLEEFGDIDILMIPVGGIYTIDGEEAAHAVKQVEPKIVIPMHYRIPDLSINLEEVEPFLKEAGAAKTEAQEKLTIKKKDIPEEGKTQVVVLKPT